MCTVKNCKYQDVIVRTLGFSLFHRQVLDWISLASTCAWSDNVSVAHGKHALRQGDREWSVLTAINEGIQ